MECYGAKLVVAVLIENAVAVVGLGVLERTVPLGLVAEDAVQLSRVPDILCEDDMR